MAILSKGNAAASQKIEAETTERETAEGWGKTLSFPYCCVLLKLACIILWKRQTFTIMNGVNEMSPFTDFLDLVVKYCRVFVFPLTSPSPSLLWSQHRGFLLWASSTNTVIKVPPQQLTVVKNCWKGSAIQWVAIPPEGESWALTLWD